MVRLQCKSGRYILESITSSTTLGDLQRAIHEKTGVPPDKQKSNDFMYTLHRIVVVYPADTNVILKMMNIVSTYS